jgi:DNA polymerase-3 subunit gamma/tau
LRSRSENELEARFGRDEIEAGFDSGAASDSEASSVEPDAADAYANDADTDGDEEMDLGGGAPALPAPRSFGEVVALAGARREVKLKDDLEERVSLVKFDAAGSIELHLLPGAPKELGNELREKLNRWTGKRWVVALSNAPGERPLGEAQREREAAELREIQSHPAVAAVLQQFPGAKIKLNPLPGTKPGDTGTG